VTQAEEGDGRRKGLWYWFAKTAREALPRNLGRTFEFGFSQAMLPRFVPAWQRIAY
jgi:hypothetical protein